MTTASLPTSLLKFFHGEAIVTVNSGSDSRCQVERQLTTFQDCAPIIFRFAKYPADQSTQLFLRVSFGFNFKLFSLTTLLHDGRQFLGIAWC